MIVTNVQQDFPINTRQSAAETTSPLGMTTGAWRRGRLAFASPLQGWQWNARRRGLAVWG